MKKNNLIIIVACLLLAFSCQKEDDLAFSDTYSASPVFTFSANNDLYDIAAGVNQFYMFTDYEIDSLNTFTFISTFDQLSTCTESCNESLAIMIRDFREAISPIAIEDINSTITTGEYEFGDAQGIDFSDVIIEYTDLEGITYRTDLLDQDGESFFEVLSIEDYDANENGDPTKLLEVSFNCRLKDTQSDNEIFLLNARGTIGLAYPK